MITLFRRIREKLIASGSITKYLFYAIGEILLVVIGILIALQVNNWNEDRKQSLETAVLLGAIHDEFITIRSELEEVIQRKENAISRLDEIIALMGTNTPSLTREEANSHWSSILSSITADVGNPVLNNAFQSGSIHRIDDSELKTLLTSWEAEKIDLLIEVENYVRNRTSQIVDALTESYELPSGLFTDSELDTSTFDIDHRLIYTNLKLRNLLVLKKGLLNIGINENQTLIEYSDQIIERTQ